MFKKLSRRGEEKMKPEFKKKVKENKNVCCVCKKSPAIGDYKGLPICLTCKIQLILEDRRVSV